MNYKWFYHRIDYAPKPSIYAASNPLQRQTSLFDKFLQPISGAQLIRCIATWKQPTIMMPLFVIRPKMR